MKINAGRSTDRAASRGKPVRLAFAVSAAAFTLCVIIQVFLAGLAVFAGPENWELHEAFVHAFQFIPLVMLALSFFGELPSKFRWQSGVLFGLIYVMYYTAHFHEISPYVSAAHPVIAMGLFGMSSMVTLDAWKRI